jgi:hypothetical protein
MTEKQIIAKNDYEQLEIYKSEYKGQWYIHIRTYVRRDSKSDWVPTKKGIAIHADLLPDLQQAVAMLK